VAPRLDEVIVTDCQKRRSHKLLCRTADMILRGGHRDQGDGDSGQGGSGRQRDPLRVDDGSNVRMSEDVAEEGNAPAAPAPCNDDAVAGAVLWRSCVQWEPGRAHWGHKIVNTGTCNGNKHTTRSANEFARHDHDVFYLLLMGACWWTRAPAGAPCARLQDCA
jgi:hypothetical protein